MTYISKSAYRMEEGNRVKSVYKDSPIFGIKLATDDGPKGNFIHTGQNVYAIEVKESNHIKSRLLWLTSAVSILAILCSIMFKSKCTK